MSYLVKEISPLTITKTNNVKYIRVRVENLQLFTCATICVDLLDENMYCVDNKHFELCGQEYLDWQNDSYIYDIISSKFGISILPQESTPSS